MKHRYGDPAKMSKWLRRARYMYLFVAWNALAIVGYKTVGRNDPEWQKLTPVQKYFYYMGTPEKEMTVIEVRGLTVTDRREVTTDEYLDNYFTKQKQKDAEKTEQA